MTMRILALAGAMFLVFSTAHAVADESLQSAILNCAAQAGDAAQLACYRRIAAQVKAEPAQSPAPVASATPPQATAPAAKDTAAAQSLFGSRNEPDQLDRITDSVADVAFSGFGRFTVTLKNGQVWRQTEGETAHLRKGDVVIIMRGTLGGFRLSIQGGVLETYGSYGVKRIS